MPKFDLVSPDGQPYTATSAVEHIQLLAGGYKAVPEKPADEKPADEKAEAKPASKRST